MGRIIGQLWEEERRLPPGAQDLISKNKYSANGVSVHVEKVERDGATRVEDSVLDLCQVAYET